MSCATESLLVRNIFNKEGKKMKKAGLVFLALLILGTWAAKDSDAAQWCWQFSGSTEYIKLSVVKPDPSYPFWSLNGMWYEPGAMIIPLVGTMVKNADNTGRVLTLYGTYPGTAGHSYSINMEVDKVTKDGVAHLYYIRIDTSADSPIASVPCSSLPAP
jgi:hypothetical protein